MAPIKLQIVVIYRPPGQILAPFLEELDGLLSSFMEDGTPLLVFGDFNIHLEKPYATDFHSLLASFDLKRLTTTSTHKSGNQLDLIYTRDCTADNILVQPLHISDHFFIKFTLHFATRVPPTPLPVTFRRNLRSLSPSHLSSVVSSSLPSPTNFSSLDVNAATDTLCSTLTTCLDDICPLSSRPARTAPSNPWLSDVLREHRTRLRAAERKWRKSNEPSDLSMYQSFLSSFSVEVHTAKSSHFHNKINNAPGMRNLFRTFNSLLCPPPPPPTMSITADDFATFFTNKTKTISSQFSPPLIQDPQPTRSTAQTPIFSFCPLTEAEVSKLLLSSHPTTSPLDPIPSHLLQAISPALLPALTHIINTSLLTGIFPTAFKQARVTPLLKKPTLNTSLLENYRPVSLLPFIAKTLERVVFNQVSLFLSQNNKLDATVRFQEWPFNWDCATIGHWSPANCKSRFQIISPHSAGSLCRFWHCQSSDPPVHPLITGYHWDSTSLVWILSHWSVFQGGLGGEVSKAHQLVTGVPQGSVLGPSSSPHTLHHWLPSYRNMASPTISMLMTHSSISHFDQMIQR